MSYLIALDGTDASGKATQTALLEKRLSDDGFSVRTVSFPDYDSPSSGPLKMYLEGKLGKDPNDTSAYAASVLFAVDRFASFKLKWKDDFDNGTLILADRYATSNSIYQMEKISEDKWDEYLKWTEDFEYDKIGIPRPDAVIYLDMPVDISQRLMTSRYHGDEGKKDVHEVNVDFLNACRKSALYAAEKQGWHIVNCSDGKNPYSVEKIHKAVVEIVDKELSNA